jgi:riboflavin biosynthesis pyrimidine reductase
MKPLELLFEQSGLPSFELPDELRTLYGGPFGLQEPLVYANFVQTIDGTVAITELEQSNRLISGESDPDRFVMGLLRACADVVVIGSGTLRASPNALWLPDRVYPKAADGFAEVRQRLGRAPSPQVAVVTASGAIDASHPVLEAGALVLTSNQGAAALEGRLPSAATVVSLGTELTVDPVEAIHALRERGHGRVLSEAGPALFGSFLAAGLVDELFLTVSPYLAGGAHAASRLSLGEGLSLLPTQRLEATMTSARRDDSYLFLRYAFARGPEDAG